MAYVQRQNNNSNQSSNTYQDNGLTFESDGIPQFCGEFREIDLRIVLYQRGKELKVTFAGADYKYRKCFEEDPKCFRDGTELLPGRYTAEIKYELDNRLNKPFPMPMNLETEKYVCNATCTENMREVHSTSVLVDVLSDRSEGEPSDASGIMNLVNVAKVLCSSGTDDGGFIDGMELTVDFKFRCYMKKSECREALFGNTCVPYLKWTGLGYSLDDDGLAQLSADLAAVNLGIDLDDLDAYIDVLTSTPKKGLPSGFLDWMLNKNKYLGLDGQAMDNALFCDVLNSILNSEDCAFKDLSISEQESRMLNCLENESSPNFTQLWDIVTGGGREAAIRYVVGNLKKCLCEEGD